MSAHDDFFRGKRPWSIIKDNVLRHYMPRYLAKVNTLGRRILLVDGYAGAGVYDDGSPGSPLIMLQHAEARAKGNYDAIFVNKSREHHERLTTVLAEHIRCDGWSTSARTQRGDAREILPALSSRLHDETVFLYVDPFGPTGCAFSLLLPFLRRDHERSSTEIVLTLCMPAMHRFAETRKVREGRWSSRLDSGSQSRLTDILGGDYWKDILWRDDWSAERREVALIEAYCRHISHYLPVTRYCPVRERHDSRIKYFIVFASRHRDALVLMNDGMAQAYYSHMHRQHNLGGLFEDSDWREMRAADGFATGLDEAITEAVAHWPRLSRKDLWARLVDHYFMLYTETEYRQAIKRMDAAGVLVCERDRKTGRLNDSSRIALPAHAG